MIGSLTYASIATRPDLSAAVGALSQVMNKPGQQHVKGVKRILRYIKGTLNYGLSFCYICRYAVLGTQVLVQEKYECRINKINFSIKRKQNIVRILTD